MNNKIKYISLSLIAIGLVLGGILIDREWIQEKTLPEIGTFKDTPYGLETLHTLNTETITTTCEVKASNFKKDFEIKKWEGEDKIICAPFGNIITLFKSGEYWKQYVFPELASINDVTLSPDKITFNSMDFAAGTSAIYEFDYNGNCLYGLSVPGLSHQTEPLDNDNFLIIRNQYDQAMEITLNGDIVWEWNALENLRQYTTDNYVGYAGLTMLNPVINGLAVFRETINYNAYIGGEPNWQTEWTHINGVQKIGDTYLLNLRNLDLALLVDKDCNPIWSYGAGIIKHTHHSRLTNDYHLLTYDNGNGRALEIDAATGEVIWEYTGLDSPFLGWIERYDNSYLFPDTLGGKILEVSIDGNVLKEVVIGMPMYQCKGYDFEFNSLNNIY